MNITYDPIADALYIYIRKDRKSTRTEEIRDDFLVDFHKNHLVGIELLGISSQMSKKELENVTLSVPLYNVKKLLH